MPFPNENSCRLRNPADFREGTFRSMNRRHEGKPFRVILGKLKGENEMTEQAYRYDKDVWTAGQARSHCSAHDGRFEGVSEEEALTMDDLAKLDMEARDADLEALKAYKAGDEKAPIIYKATGAFQGIVKGAPTFIASEESPDRMGDLIDIAGWDFKEFQANPVFLWVHDAMRPPLGKVSKVWTKGKQLLSSVEWDMEDPFAAFVAGKYERGFMRAVSVGFRALEFEERKDGEASNGRPGIHFTKQELVEISACPIPAHPHALMKALQAGLWVPTVKDTELPVLIPKMAQAEMAAKMRDMAAQMTQMAEEMAGEEEEHEASLAPQVSEALRLFAASMKEVR